MIKFKVTDRDIVETRYFGGTLNVISSIFDPEGPTGPVVLQIKLLVQELWKRGLDWDTVITVDLSKQWKARKRV